MPVKRTVGCSQKLHSLCLVQKFQHIVVFSCGCVCQPLLKQRQFPVSICLCPWCWRKQCAIFVSVHGAERTHLWLSIVVKEPAYLGLCLWSWINRPSACVSVRGPECTNWPPVSLSVVLKGHLCPCPWCWKNSTTCVSVCGAEDPNQALSLHRVPWGTFPLDHFSDVGWPLILSGDIDTCLHDMSTMAFM